MPQRVVSEQRVPAQHRDEPARSERSARATQDLAVGADEGQLGRQVAAGDGRRERGLGVDLLQREQPEAIHGNDPAQPRGGVHAQPAVAVVQERPASVHRAHDRAGASATLSLVTTTNVAAAAESPSPLPADDPTLFELDLRELRRRWSDASGRAAIGAEAMAGIDLKAQKLGMAGQRLMEHAGAAVAAATKALAEATERWRKGPILILCGPGNNGGDGFVAARHLARAGADVAVVLVSSSATPSTPDATRNWNRLDRDPRVTRIHASTGLELKVLGKDIDRASVVVDALLGTGVHGVLRDPIRSAVELVLQARKAKVPVVAVDTPTALDLTSGDPSDPVARADLTVTFHRPKTGLLTKRGAALAGKVLVAPIGIPLAADRG